MKLIFKLCIPGYYEYIQIIKNSTEKVLETFKINEEELYTTKLAVAEAAINIIKHSYKGEGDNLIEYSIYSNYKDEIRFIFEDNGDKIDLKNIKSRDLDKLDDHGLGVYLIKSIMDKVEYKHVEKGTKLSMTKKIGVDFDD